MTYNQNQYGQAPQQPQGYGQVPQQPQAQQYPKRTKQTFAGKITQDLVVEYAQQTGNPYLRINFIIENEKLENGGQWAQITIFGEDAKILAYLLEKNDVFVGTGYAKWETYTDRQGEERKSLSYDYPSVHLDFKNIKKFVRTELAVALQDLQKQPQSEQPQPQAQPQAQEQPQTQPQTQTQATEKEPVLSIDDDMLPF